VSARVARALSIDDLRRLARRKLPRAVFDFFDGGAEDEGTLRDNRDAYGRLRLLPKVLVDVANVDPSTDILGVRSALPIATAPTGAIGFGRRGADFSVARAAAAFGIPYSLATPATASIEGIAEATSGRHWFQFYMLNRPEFVLGLVERARVAGYEALIITVDLPVGGKRERDFRNDFAIPFRFTPRNVLDFATRPAWALEMLRHGIPVQENLVGFEPAATGAVQQASSVGSSWDPSFDWSRLQRLRDRWPRKLIVKGIVRPDDALRAATLGADAIIVSNHGGRQLDGGIATIDALADIVAAVGGRMDVLIDGGIRRGRDIVKALALGAKAVLIGRPMVFGACAGGDEGAARALAILREELIRTMQLCGTPRIADIERDLVVRGNDGSVRGCRSGTFVGSASATRSPVNDDGGY
jgi:(S)-mandelate dehydrogenase